MSYFRHTGRRRGRAEHAEWLKARATARRAIGDPELALANLTAQGNALLCQANTEQLFVSIFLAVVDLENARLRYVNAGHNPPWLSLPGDAPRLLDQPRNPVAGLVPELGYKSGEIDFPPGASLLLYTDGVTEAENLAEEQFGEARLAALVARYALSPAGLCQHVVTEVDAFAAGYPQADDITLLALRSLPTE